MLKRFFWFILGGVLAIAGAAAADVALTAGSGTTIFTFTCFTTKNCPPHVNINSAGTEVGTTGSPIYFDTPASGNLYSAVTGPLPTQSATVSIGGVGLVNGGAVGATGSATPASGVLMGYSSGGNLTAWDKSVTVSAGSNVIGYTSTDPCMQQNVAKANAAFSSASGTFAIVTGVSAKKIYVCSIALITPTAVSVSLAEGSSSTCGTSNQAAVIGVATSGTAANGMALPANGGFTLGNGTGTVASTATAANYLCIFQSGTAQIAGNLTYVQQ